MHVSHMGMEEAGKLINRRVQNGSEPIKQTEKKKTKNID